MGLDAVVFVMKVEEEFELHISDQDASRIRSPRHLIDYLVLRLDAAQEPDCCLSQRVFYRVRQTLMRSLRVERNSIRPGSELELLVPRENRSPLWKRLQRELTLPDLERPAFMGWAIFFLSLCAGWSSFVLMHVLGADLGAALALGMVLAGSLGLSFFFLTEPWRIELPKQLQRVSGLIRYLSPASAIPSPKAGERWTRTTIKIKVFALMCEQFGLSIADFDEDSNFVEDLGID